MGLNYKRMANQQLDEFVLFIDTFRCDFAKATEEERTVHLRETARVYSEEHNKVKSLKIDPTRFEAAVIDEYKRVCPH